MDNNSNYINVFQYGNKILERGYHSDGTRFDRKVEFKPTIFLDVNKNKVPSEWKTLDGKPVYPIQPGTIKDCKEFLERYKEVEGLTTYCFTNWDYQYIAETYPNQCKFDPDKIRIFFCDIETSTEGDKFPNLLTADQEVLLITIYDSLHKRYITFASKDFEIPEGKTVIKIIGIDEEHTLKLFLKFWTENYPDVLTGWNTDGFDIPYLVRRLNRILGDNTANKLSPWSIVKERTVQVKGKSKIFFEIAGISCIDYIDIYKKSTAIPKRENYKLGFIGQVDLGITKVENPYNSFREFYSNDFSLFSQYNIRDVELVVGLDDKYQLLALTMTMGYEAKVNFEDIAGQIKVWEAIAYNYLLTQKIVVPNKEFTAKTEQFDGAYVKEVNKGLHKWIVSFDLDSLYPSLIMWGNMSPETMVQYRKEVDVDGLLEKRYDLSELKGKNYAMVGNGVCFSREKQGFLPYLMETFYSERKKFKREMLDAEQKYEELVNEANRRGLKY